MVRKSILVVSLVFSAYLHAQRPATPNFLLILADDLGWQDVKVYDRMETNVVNGFGGTNVFETPHMDALASEGILFTQAYSPAPVCAPSRVAIMSGKHPGRTDVTSVSGGECPKARSVNSKTLTPHYRSSLKDEEISLPEALRPLGYFSGVFGKWHMSPDGHHSTFPLPTDQGFDRAYNGRGVQSGLADRLTGFATTDPSDPYQLDANGFATDPVTENALGFLAEAVALEQPFFCYYSTWLVHAPWQMRTESLLQKYAARMGYAYPLDGSEKFPPGQKNPYYAAMVESLDYYMSRLILYLKETDDPRWPGHKLIENTYVILTSDNGGMENGEAHGGKVTDNFPLDQGKIWIKEGGTRVPFLVSGPGISSNLISDVVVNGMDLYPSVLGLLGEEIPDRLDGCDLSDLWRKDPLDPARVRHHQTGEARETMFWHFPHSGRVATTLRKDGWKLYKNYETSRAPYSLYHLYDGAGNPDDVGEMNDVMASHPEVAAELTGELDAWIAAVDARPAYLNPQASGLAGSDQSPQILSSGNDDTMAWVRWNTDRAEIKHIDLVYTKSPTADRKEEWFKIPVPFTFSKGWAEVPIPTGAKRFLFNLVDEHRFFVGSVDLTGHKTYDSERVPRPVWVPGPTGALLDAGTRFPSDDVLFSNPIREPNAFSAVRDDGANLQVLGQTFTVTEPVRLSGLTLQAYTDFTVGGTDASQYVFWIGRYEEGAPSLAPYRTRVFEYVDLRNMSCVADRYYTLDFDDTVLLPGRYAFQIRWAEQGAGNNSYWARAAGAGDYPGGDRIHLLTSAGSEIDLPFSQEEGIDSDLVFALHGKTDYFGGWALAHRLDRIPSDLSFEDLGSAVRKGNVSYNKAGTSEWRILDGALRNSSAVNDRTGEAAIGICIDVRDLEDSDASELALRFDYEMEDADEKLYVHLWGIEDLDAGSNPSIMNLGAQNGNAWVSAGATMNVYNLGRADGVFAVSAGVAGDAAVAGLSGVTGAQRFSQTFDLAGFTTAPNAVSDYDYLVLGFARDVGGTLSPSVSITDIRLGLVGREPFHTFPPADTIRPDHLNADPDGDGAVNFHEYVFDGDPQRDDDVGFAPGINALSATAEYTYLRRRTPAGRELHYTVETKTNLLSAAWDTNGVTEIGVGGLDPAFEVVTNRVEVGQARFLRLRVDLNE